MTQHRLRAWAYQTVMGLRDLFVGLVAMVAFLVARIVPERAFVRATGCMAQQLGMRIPRLTRIGMRNLALAFPDLSEAQHRAILRESWDNMGRTAAEYFFIDDIWDVAEDGSLAKRIEIGGAEHFERLAADGLPGMILSAHLGNWELPMVAARRHGLDATALFTRPRNPWIARLVMSRRQAVMDDLIMSGPGALRRLADALEEGRHLGLLVDQFHERGPVVSMFGHSTRANPIFARLARHHDCPVHMVRVVRLPLGRFRVELSEPLVLRRDTSGRVDVQAATQQVAAILEGWIREHPGQWLWVHRRWR